MGGVSALHWWLLLQYLFLNIISIFFSFFEFWLSGLNHLSNRLSSYVLFFLVNKRFQAEKAFNYKVLGWCLLTHARNQLLIFLNTKRKQKSHYQSLLADELLILWGCWSGSHEPVKYTPAYFVLLPSNWFVSIWS